MDMIHWVLLLTIAISAEAKVEKKSSYPVPTSAFKKDLKRKPGAIENPSASVSPSPGRSGPATVVFSLPPKGKAPKQKLNLLQKIALNYSKKKWARVIDQSSALETQSENLDLALHLKAEAYYQQAVSAAKKSSWNAVTKNVQSSIPLLLKLIETSPESPYTSSVGERLGKNEILLAQSLAYQKKTIQSLSYFHRAFERIKESRLIAMMEFEQFKLYAKACQANKQPKCYEWIAKFAEHYPRESIEKKFIAEQLVTFVEPTGNNPYYDRLSRNYKAPDPDQVAFEEVLPLILKGDYRELIEKGQKFLEQFPKTTYRTRTQYWIAYSYWQRDNKEKATPLFEQIIKESPISYYSILSTLVMGKEPQDYLKKDPPAASDEDILLSADEKRFIKRATDFSVMGAAELARQELKAIDTKKNFSNPFLVFLAKETCKNQNYATCYRILTELNQRSFSDLFDETALDLYFPDVFQDWIMPTASNQGLDPLLVTSLIKQESAFNAEAVSSVGAMGLMQLMPFTAVGVDNQIEQAKITDPRVNIKLGTQYLSELVRKFNGNWVYALAGYNAGPHRVDKWLKETGSKLGMIEFMESIPYKETRDYVATIVRNYYWYTYKRQGKKLKSLEVFWAKPAIESASRKTPVPGTKTANRIKR